jgi:hypothetical protein
MNTPRGRRGRPISTLGLAVALTLGGGGALAVASLGSGTASGATTDSTTTTTTTTTTPPLSTTTPSTTTPSTSSSNSPSSTSSLGGFTVTALAEALTAQYEQPNLPLPSTPSLEFDEGYADTTDNFGPTGTATASTLYPGQVVANAGPELGLLVPDVPLPPAPTWPVEAVSSYPQSPNTAATDQAGMNMDADSSAGDTTASATLGDDAPTAGSSGSPNAASSATAGAGNPLAASSAFLGIGQISATSSSGAPAADAVGTATATDTGISILNGFITIGGVTSTASATSDGTTGSLSGSTVLSNVAIDGESVTIDAHGIAAAGQNEALALPVSSLNSMLTDLGITLSLTNPTDSVTGPSASRTLDGLKISINLDTLDKAANTIADLLPASLTSQLPVPLPDQQLLTLDFGTVTVASAAAPSFSAPDATDGTAGSDGLASAFVPALSTGSYDPGSDGTGGSFGGSGVADAAAPSSAPTGSAADQPTSALTPVFTGIGAGVVLLGVLAALAMAYAYKRVDDLSELTGASCANGDPLSDLFDEGGAPIDGAGGFVP